jgi:hypothetical protein
MKCRSFEDEYDDKIETLINCSGSCVSIADGNGSVYIGVKSIDKLIQALQELKGEINE